jgi:urea transporter
MRTGWNIALQLTALAAFVIMRLGAFGWLTLMFVLTLIGPILVLVPTGLAVGTVRRRRLTPAVTVPFIAAACFLVLAGAVYPDYGDSPEAFAPVVSSRISPPSELVTILFAIGNLAAVGFLASIFWTVVAVGRSVGSRPIS